MGNSEVWPLKKHMKCWEKTEKAFGRSKARRSGMERKPNSSVEEVMKVKHALIKDIKEKQLIWFGIYKKSPTETENREKGEKKMPTEIIETTENRKLKHVDP